jgi:hypothetical protein
LQTFGQGQGFCEEVHCLLVGAGTQSLLAREFQIRERLARLLGSAPVISQQRIQR